MVFGVELNGQEVIKDDCWIFSTLFLSAIHRQVAWSVIIKQMAVINSIGVLMGLFRVNYGDQ